MKKFLQLASAGLIALALLCATAPAALAAGDPADRDPLAAATTAMCDRKVVLLGEASHGDGHSDAFKAALVERLVSDCHFNTVLFEASFYEFAPLLAQEGARKPATPELIAAAVGALWKFDAEVQPLFAFLAPRINANEVDVGGLDFQAGGFQQPYANDAMIVDLAAVLPAERASACQAVYHARVYDDDLPPGQSAATRHAALAACLVEMGAARQSPDAAAARPALREQELRNLSAWLSVADGDPAGLVRARDRMMADNARWFIDRSPRKVVKTVVWTHNGHAAKDIRSFADQPGPDNVGSLLSRRFGRGLFALGVTACAGEYRWSRGVNRAILPPPDDSLESAFCARDPGASVLVDAATLERSGKSVAGLLGHAYRPANWTQAFDAVLFLGAEHPPHSALH